MSKHDQKYQQQQQKQTCQAQAKLFEAGGGGLTAN